MTSKVAGIKVFVGGVSPDVTSADLTELFQSRGSKVQNAITCKAKDPGGHPFAMVFMVDALGADRAIKDFDGYLLKGSRLKVRPGIEKPPQPQRVSGNSSASTGGNAFANTGPSPSTNFSPKMNSPLVSFSSTTSAPIAGRFPNVSSIACYDAQDQVGEGTYGYVYRAIDKRNNSVVALKRLIVHKDYLGFPLCAVRELKFLKSLQHKNIVRLLDVAISKGVMHLDKAIKTDKDGAGAGAGVAAGAGAAAAGGAGAGAGGVAARSGTKAGVSDVGKDGTAVRKKSEHEKAKERDQEASSLVLSRCSNLYLVFEYVEHDLGGLVDAKYSFQPRVVKSIIKQLLEVLDFLETKKILHRDIKSSNILISNMHQIKLADFGLARSTLNVTCGTEGKMDLTNNVVTMWYRAPELLLGATRYSYGVDMWSAGCVLAELEIGRPLFPGKSETEQLDLICRTMGTFTEGDWPEMSSLPHYDSLFKAIPRYTNSIKQFTCSNQRLSPDVLMLLERVLVANPLKRSSASNALGNRYFKAQPQAPNDPTELGMLGVTESLHEFQTKQKRRAKERAEDERRKALREAEAVAAAAAAAGAGSGGGAGGGTGTGVGASTGMGASSTNLSLPPKPPMPQSTSSNPFVAPRPPMQPSGGDRLSGAKRPHE